MRIVLLRGVSGAGKTSFAKSLIDLLPEGQKGIICSADNFFMDKDKYNFQYIRLDEAHRDCFCRFWVQLETRKHHLVIVDNTNTQLHELSPYVMAAKVNMQPEDSLEIIRIECDYKVAAARNVHNVPLSSVKNMAQRMQNLPKFWPKERIIRTDGL